MKAFDFTSANNVPNCFQRNWQPRTQGLYSAYAKAE